MITLMTEGAPPLSLSDPLSLSFLFFTFAFGASLGSFTNVLIFRIPMDMSIAWPPSACRSCRRPIRWYENIPIFGYLALRGRCAGCNASISLQYPFVELIVGVWSIAIGSQVLWPVYGQPDQWASGLVVLVPYAIKWLWLTLFTCALIAIALIDLRYTFVPDEISITLTWIGLAGGFFIPINDPLELFFGALAGYAVICMVRWLGYLYYRREAMGLGDAKLLAMIGAFLGWRALPWVLFGAAVQGIVAAMIAIGYTRITGRSNLLTMTSEELAQRFGEDTSQEQEVMLVMPFGPFLCIAAFEVMMIGIDSLTTWVMVTP